MAEYEPENKKDVNSIKRYTHRARYDEQSIHKILDAGVCAHVTFQLPLDPDGPQQVDAVPAIPMAYGRIDDVIYLHGYVGSRLLKALSEDGARCCLTVTNVQGYIIALAPYHNDCNFETAILFGNAELCTGKEQLTGLKAVTNEIWRGVGYNRWEDSRFPTDAELKSTRVIKMQIEKASAKVSDKGVEDDQKDIQDVAGKYWSGIIKREERWTHAVPADSCKIAEPDYVKKLLAISNAK